MFRKELTLTKGRYKTLQKPVTRYLGALQRTKIWSILVLIIKEHVKIRERLFNVPVRPVISNCGTPTEKASEFLDSHLKTIMQESWSYIKDSGNFTNKMSQFRDFP